MSGGHFDYQQWHCTQMAEDIEAFIQSGKMEKYELKDPKTEKRFREAIKILKLAGNMAHEIDYLISGDTGEKTFHERWEEKIQSPKNQ